MDMKFMVWALENGFTHESFGDKNALAEARARYEAEVEGKKPRRTRGSSTGTATIVMPNGDEFPLASGFSTQGKSWRGVLSQQAQMFLLQNGHVAPNDTEALSKIELRVEKKGTKSRTLTAPGRAEYLDEAGKLVVVELPEGSKVVEPYEETIKNTVARFGA